VNNIYQQLQTLQPVKRLKDYTLFVTTTMRQALSGLSRYNQKALFLLPASFRRTGPLLAGPTEIVPYLTLNKKIPVSSVTPGFTCIDLGNRRTGLFSALGVFILATFVLVCHWDFWGFGFWF